MAVNATQFRHSTFQSKLNWPTSTASTMSAEICAPRTNSLNDEVAQQRPVNVDINVIPPKRSWEKQAVALGGAVLGGIGGAAAQMALGPLAGGAVMLASHVYTSDSLGYRPFKECQSDGQVKKALKSLVNGVTEAATLVGIFTLGAIGGPVLAATWGASAGYKAGSEVADRLSAVPQMQVSVH